MSGLSRTHSIWETAVCMYAGYELVAITEYGPRESEYVIACPEEDFKIMMDDYHGGRLALSDALAFVAAFNRVSKIQREFRQTGEKNWTHPDYLSGRVG